LKGKKRGGIEGSRDDKGRTSEKEGKKKRGGRF